MLKDVLISHLQLRGFYYALGGVETEQLESLTAVIKVAGLSFAHGLQLSKIPCLQPAVNEHVKLNVVLSCLIFSNLSRDRVGYTCMNHTKYSIIPYNQSSIIQIHHISYYHTNSHSLTNRKFDLLLSLHQKEYPKCQTMVTHSSKGRKHYFSKCYRPTAHCL